MPTLVENSFHDLTFDEPDNPQTATVDVPAGSDLFAIASFSWVDAPAHTISGVTLNGDPMVEFATVSDTANNRKHTFYLKNPDVGTGLSLTVSTASGTANAAVSCDFLVYEDVDQTDSFDWMTPTTGQDTSPATDDATNAEITINSASGCKVVALFSGEFSATATAATLTGVTKFQENHNNTISSAVGEADGDTSVVAAATWTVAFGSVDWIAQGISLNPAAGAGAYSLTAETGSFTMTGVAATPRAARRLPLVTGSFTETGVAAGMSYGRILEAEHTTFGAAAVSFELTGIAATLDYSGGAASQAYTLDADRGHFEMTGRPATLDYSGASEGAVYHFAVSRHRRRIYNIS